MKFGSPAQTFGRPTDTDRSRSLKGEVYEFTGFVDVDGDPESPASSGATAEQPTLVLASITTDGAASKLEWDEPDGLFTFNLGDFFTLTPSSDGPDIAAAADCLVQVTAWMEWANGGGTYSPAGTRHVLEVTGLQTISPVADIRYQHSTPYTLPMTVSAVGKLAADSPMWVSANHNDGDPQTIALAYVAVTRLALL